MDCRLDSNAVIAVAAVASLVVTFFLCWATKRTADIASETLSISIPPKLTIAVLGIVDEGPRISILVKLMNGGAGHAVITKIISTVLTDGDAAEPKIENHEGITILGNSFNDILMPMGTAQDWAGLKRTGFKFHIIIDISNIRI